MRITDTTVKETLDIPNTRFYRLKREEPNSIELIKKGLLLKELLTDVAIEELKKGAIYDSQKTELINLGLIAERVLSSFTLDEMIKKPNKIA